jgi:hypothetical protein
MKQDNVQEGMILNIEPSKDKQKELIVEIMKEDEADGLYDIPNSDTE